MSGRINHASDFKKAAQSSNTTGKLEEFIQGISGISTAGKPSLIYLYTSGQLPKNDPAAQQLKVAMQKCLAVEKSILYTRTFYAPLTATLVQSPTMGTRHDFRIAIGAKQFNVASVNLFGIEPLVNLDVNRFTVPMIVITDAQGKIAKVHKGSTLRTSSIFSTMTQVMREAGYNNFAAQVTQANRALDKVYKYECQIAKYGKTKSPQIQAGIDKLRERIDKEMETFNEAVAKCAEKDTTAQATRR